MKNKFCLTAFLLFSFFFSTYCKKEDKKGPCEFGSKTFFALAITNNPNTGFCNGLGKRIGSGTGTETGIGTVSSSKDISAYSIPSIGVTGIITGTEINLFAESITSFTPFVATFTTTGQSVKIGATTQTSGTTANNYSSTLTYIVTAEDSTTKTYTVKMYAPMTVATSNLKAWFKGNSLALANGADVNSWTDSSGTGNTVTTASNFPTFVASAKNGLPAISFPGTVDRSLTKTSGTDLITTAHSIITVFKPQISATNIVILSFGTAACGRDKVFQILTTGTINTGICNVHSLENLGIILTSNTYYIAANSYINSGTSNLFLDGTNIKSDVPPAGTYTNNSTMVIGKRSIDNTAFFNGEIAEILYYNTNLSTVDIQTLNCYLSKKYAIAVSNSCN